MALGSDRHAHDGIGTGVDAFDFITIHIQRDDFPGRVVGHEENAVVVPHSTGLVETAGKSRMVHTGVFRVFFEQFEVLEQVLFLAARGIDPFDGAFPVLAMNSSPARSSWSSRWRRLPDVRVRPCIATNDAIGMVIPTGAMVLLEIVENQVAVLAVKDPIGVAAIPYDSHACGL